MFISESRNSRISAVNSYSAWWKWNLNFSFFPPLFSDTVIHFSACSFRAWCRVTEVNGRFSMRIVWEQEQAITRARHPRTTFSCFLFVPAPCSKVTAEHFSFLPCSEHRHGSSRGNFPGALWCRALTAVTPHFCPSCLLGSNLSEKGPLEVTLSRPPLKARPAEIKLLRALSSQALKPQQPLWAPVPLLDWCHWRFVCVSPLSAHPSRTCLHLQEQHSRGSRVSHTPQARSSLALSQGDPKTSFPGQPYQLIHTVGSEAPLHSVLLYSVLISPVNLWLSINPEPLTRF